MTKTYVTGWAPAGGGREARPPIEKLPPERVSAWTSILSSPLISHKGLCPLDPCWVSAPDFNYTLQNSPCACAPSVLTPLVVATYRPRCNTCILAALKHTKIDFSPVLPTTTVREQITAPLWTHRWSKGLTVLSKLNQPGLSSTGLKLHPFKHCILNPHSC